MTPCCRSTVRRHGRKTTTGCCTRLANRFDHPIYRSAAGTLNVVPTVRRRVGVCSAFSDVAGAWHCRHFLRTPPMRSPRAQIADAYVRCVWEQGRQAAALKNAPAWSGSQGLPCRPADPATAAPDRLGCVLALFQYRCHDLAPDRVAIGRHMQPVGAEQFCARFAAGIEHRGVDVHEVHTRQRASASLIRRLALITAGSSCARDGLGLIDR